MIKSMTAFSRTEAEQSGFSVAIEIRSYNSRYLDIVLHLPHELYDLEDKIRKRISEQVTRGRVSIRIDLKKIDEDTEFFDVDIIKATAYLNALSRLQTALNISGEISLDLILAGADMIIPAKTENDLSLYWQIVESCLSKTLDDFDAMRKQEGDFLSSDLSHRLDFLTNCIEQIEQASNNLLPLYQERLKERISLLIEGTIELDPDRITQEAAILADKSDVSEEIVRVKSHIEQFRQIMNDEQPAGRKLNFLLQEFNREFNTIGSKIAKADVSYTVVDAKSEVEKMREQVQNIE